jgi:hypothetical protein
MSAPLSWDTLDWTALDRLREGFLQRQGADGSYWNSRDDLANYDFTYAQRIGWKWDAVLQELRRRGWTPPPGPMLDWGCGSGIAARRVLDTFGAAPCHTLRVFDRSPLAMDYAATRAAERFPGLRVETWDPTTALAAEAEDGPGTLVISHVLNELDEAGGKALRAVIDRAAAVLWVEPGTHADSRALIAVRASLRDTFHVIAPCPHQEACGLLAPENARHWCHHFADPPPGLMADAHWVRFAQRAGIDLRRLPYSFLVLERKPARDITAGLPGSDWNRVLGEPRMYKGFAKVLACQAGGVRELELQKRDAPDLFKAMKAGESPALLRGPDDGRRFQSVEDTR